MANTPKYYIVEAQALPEIFRKVAEAKQMLETGETDKVNVAAKAVGISRSAFYKYRDTIAPFQNLMAGRIITFQLVLKDRAGVLSSILSIFASLNADLPFFDNGVSNFFRIIYVLQFFNRYYIVIVKQIADKPDYINCNSL